MATSLALDCDKEPFLHPIGVGNVYQDMKVVEQEALKDVVVDLKRVKRYLVLVLVAAACSVGFNCSRGQAT